MAAKGSSSKGNSGNNSSNSSYRSAVSGRYVTPAYGKSHPNTTVKESNKSK